MKHLPNLITVIRILSIPVFIALVVHGYELHALGVFIFAGVSDAIDGIIARSWDLRTKLGTYLDPIADKLLLVSSYITLAMVNIIPLWITIIVIARDVVIGITGLILLNFIDIRSYKVRPSLLGKSTTWFQLITIALALMGKKEPLFSIIIILTALSTIASGLHYIYREIRFLQA